MAAVVARGEAEIGFQQVSEIIHTPGITYLGPIPKELQPGFSFSGAITSNATQTQGAAALIRFLSDPSVSEVVVKTGLIPVTRTK